MRGAGMQPAGTSPAGYGAPATVVADTTVMLPDVDNGVSLGSRKIDLRTNDYVVDESGRIVGMSNVQQDVMLAVLRAKPRLAQIDRLLPGFERDIFTILSAECQPIVAAGLIEILGMTNTRVGRADGLREGQAVTRFNFREISTGEERGIPV